MSEYKGIKGFQVQTRTEDPVPYAQALADNPYAGVWSSGGNVNEGSFAASGAGTQTAAVLFSGNPNPSTVTTTTEYDGTNYSEGGAMNNSRGYGPIASGT